jgi:hypothetical protein
MPIMVQAPRLEMRNVLKRGKYGILDRRRSCQDVAVKQNLANQTSHAKIWKGSHHAGTASDWPSGFSKADAA